MLSSQHREQSYMLGIDTTPEDTQDSITEYTGVLVRPY